MEYKGIGFPVMFNNGLTVNTGNSSQGSRSLDKIKADLRLIMKQALYKTLMRPRFGIDWDSLLFIDDYEMTEDLIENKLNEALGDLSTDVKIEGVKVSVEGNVANVGVKFIYQRGVEGFTLNYAVGGGYIE